MFGNGILGTFSGPVTYHEIPSGKTCCLLCQNFDGGYKFGFVKNIQSSTLKTILPFACYYCDFDEPAISDYGTYFIQVTNEETFATYIWNFPWRHVTMSSYSSSWAIATDKNWIEFEADDLYWLSSLIPPK